MLSICSGTTLNVGLKAQGFDPPKILACALLLEGPLNAGPLWSVYRSYPRTVTSRGFPGISHILESELKHVTDSQHCRCFVSLFPKIVPGILISQKHCTRVPTLRHGRQSLPGEVGRQRWRKPPRLCFSPPTWLDKFLQRCILFASKHCQQNELKEWQ